MVWYKKEKNWMRLGATSWRMMWSCWYNFIMFIHVTNHVALLSPIINFQQHMRGFVLENSSPECASGKSGRCDQKLVCVDFRVQMYWSLLCFIDRTSWWDEKECWRYKTFLGYKTFADCKAGEIAHYLVLYFKIIEHCLLKHSKRPESSMCGLAN